MVTILAGMAWTTIYTGIVRYVLALLALFVVARCIRSMMSVRKASKVWALVKVERQDEKHVSDNCSAEECCGDVIPVSSWENLVGTHENCDIQIKDETAAEFCGLLCRSARNVWRYRALRSEGEEDPSEGAACTEDGNVRAKGDDMGSGHLHRGIVLNYGGSISVGKSRLTLESANFDERENRGEQSALTEGDGWRILSPWPAIIALTIFQSLTALQLCIASGWTQWGEIVFYMAILSAFMWTYTIRSARRGQKCFEIETLAFFLSTISLSIIISGNISEASRQIEAIFLGIVIMVLSSKALNKFDRIKTLRWIILCGGTAIAMLNLILGTVTNGAKNWIIMGELSIQPSELLKLALIWAGAATLKEIYVRRQIFVFLIYAALILGSLAIIKDFGTASVFFVAILVILFMRNGKLWQIAVLAGGATAAMLLLAKVRPHVAARFASWGHVWEPDVINAAGYQQTRAMSGAASGGLFGVGAGNGWLKNVVAADTDMVFGVVTEEWGLAVSLLTLVSIVGLGIFAVLSAKNGKSSFYVIAACGAASMIVFQSILNVLGSMDIIMFTGVTLPFVSNGGTSMMVSWIMLSFLKAADVREEFGVKAEKGGGS